MRDSFGLEPKNGDYVEYIQGLQNGRIRNLSPLSVDANEMDEEDQSVMDALQSTVPTQGGTVSLPGSQPDAIPESATERMRRKAREANRKRGSAAIGMLSAFIGFSMFIVGGITGQEILIPIGMVITIIGFQAAARR